MEIKAEWKHVERPNYIYTNPPITSDIYLHFSELAECLKKYAKFTKGKLLDVGSGKSPYRPFFEKYVDKYITLDNHSFEEKKPDIVADVTKKIPLKSNSMDSVICIQLLEHVTNPQKVIDEIYRVLKPNGVCILTTHMATVLHGLPHDYFRFTKYGLKFMFKKFKNVKVKENGGALLSIFQLICWGLYEKLPKFIATPIIVILNIIGKNLDKIFYDSRFTINYLVFAKK